jgi:acetyl esterase/lipase
MIGSDEHTSFSSGDLTVHGTLRMPETVGHPVPGVVIIAGSGPTDRDGNSAVPGFADVRMDTHVWLAEVLAGRGVASLRYDKFGAGETGLGPFEDRPGDAAERTFDELFVQVARDALRHLGNRHGIDADRLLFLGHSEGGMVALAAAVDAGDGPTPAGLALIEPQYGRILDILERQLTDVLGTTPGVEPADATTLGAWIRTGVTSIRGGTELSPEDAMDPLPEASGATAQLQATIHGTIFQQLRTTVGVTQDRVDPVTLAARWDHPSSVLITCGTADFNTPLNPGGPPGSGVDSLAAAFADGVAELVVIDGMIHELRDLAGADPRAIGPADIPTLAFSSALHTSLGEFVDQWATA